MNTEITLKDIPLTRSGYSKRGFTSAAIILAASHNSSNKIISVNYMGCHIGYISHIHYGNLPDGRVELRGDISFPISNLIAQREILNDKNVYPVCIIETALAASEARLSEVILLTEEEREFDEQEPINLKGLLNLMNLIAESETPVSATLFNKKCDNSNSRLIDHISCNEENKIYLNETGSLEAKDGYLIFDDGKTKEAIRIDTISRIHSVKNDDNSKSIFIYGHNGGMDITRGTRLSIEDLIKFIEQYKESQLAELKAS